MKKTTFIFIMVIILAVAFAVYYLYSHRPYKTKPFNREIFMAITNDMDSNRQVISSQASKDACITVRQLHSGSLKVPLSNTINLKSPACEGIEDMDLLAPIFAYLVHHERYGYFLIDTGCDLSYEDDPYGRMNGALIPLVVPETEFDLGQAIERQIPDVLDDIKGVFFTHLHPDHTSGLPVLPDSLPCIAGKGEKYFSIKGLIEPGHFNDNNVIYELDFESEEAQKLPIGRAIDIFGDRSFWAVSTPGHTTGHVSYLVNTNEETILIAGDAIISNLSLKLGSGPGTSAENLELAQETFERLYNYHKRNPDVRIWLGHDYIEE